MYKNKTVAIVIPCYNEETQINDVIKKMPNFVDKMITIDDCSNDNTINVINKISKHEKRLILIKHEQNEGVGGAIASGYKWTRDNNIDIAVVMAGDGQMDPEDLTSILDPIAEDKADYSKGNRLFSGEAYKKIPKIRYFGNSILSLLTKIASGYWHIADSQTGYTAINKKALRLVDWDQMYKRYGQPNDLLVMLNVLNMRVKDIHIKPVYNIGEKSGIKIYKVSFTISWLLLKRFLWRLKEKYIIRDFHPLVFFYFFGIMSGIISMSLFFRLFLKWWLIGYIPPINALAAMFTLMNSSLFILFAMWFDMEANKHLK